ncbi:MAG: site-specific DNA-methyltransferase [Phycisphaerae bacterium]|nr:site-specific DNA-methyltransferase [Phycisphaerae bacterium]
MSRRSGFKLKRKAFFQTDHGAAYLGDSRKLLADIPDGSVNLIMTSPPYALHFKKEYGNADQGAYVDWFLGFADDFKRVLTDDGSLVVDIGGAWTPGKPTRSLYHFELLIALCRQVGFHLAQEFYWYNPAKLPAPAEWVTVRKLRVKDAVNCLWWLSKSENPKADNRRVLVEYSADMKRLIKRGYRAKQRPSGHNITEKFGKDQGGSIPPNILIFGNNDANGTYMSRCNEAGIKPHPARFPQQLPTFFIRYLTEPGDVVLDPFCGSNTTGEAAEREGRRWVSFELDETYLRASVYRFDPAGWEPIDLSKRNGDLRGQKEPSLFDQTK